MDFRSRFVCLVALVFGWGCGGVSRVDHPGLGSETAGSDSGGADGAGRGGDEAAGRASGGSSAAGASAGGAGRPSTCAQFKDDSRQAAVVVIINDTPAPIYIGPRMQRCGAPPLYEVRDASNSVVAAPDPCSSSCQSWVAGEPTGGCTANCLPSEVTQLEAGERIAIPWSGLYGLEAELPEACNGYRQAGDGQVMCSVAKRVEPGEYTFYATAGSDYSCNDASGCAECIPNMAGGCTIRGAIVTGTESTAQALIPLDPGYGISGSAGNANMSGDPLPIELVFRRPL